MDYNKFEDRISDWLENSMDLKERKEFEKFLEDNPKYQSKVDLVKNTITLMNNAPELKVSTDFENNLNHKIKSLNESKNINTGIFGFSRKNFAYITLSVICILMLSSYLLQPTDSTYSVLDEDSSSEQIDSEEEISTDMKDLDILNDVNGSFVSDKD